MEKLCNEAKSCEKPGKSWVDLAVGVWCWLVVLMAGFPAGADPTPQARTGLLCSRRGNVKSMGVAEHQPNKSVGS